jgi:hypothetical protein
MRTAPHPVGCDAVGDVVEADLAQRVSRCAVCVLHLAQYFFISSRSGSFRRFFFVM